MSEIAKAAPAKAAAKAARASKKPATASKPRASRATTVKAKAAKPTGLDRLAADPVAFIEAMPAVKRGAARRAFNSDLPGDLGDEFVEWCRVRNVTQRDVLRAFVTALLTDTAESDTAT